jgi:hypothetical protein
MLDGGRVVGGLAIVLVVVAGPAWLGSTRGTEMEAPAKATAGERCIEPPSEMRKSHPALLARWRDRVVRLGDRAEKLGDGRTVRLGLTGTCLGCHGSASAFCDRCHAQSAVTLSCWQCHQQSLK